MKRVELTGHSAVASCSPSLPIHKPQSTRDLHEHTHPSGSAPMLRPALLCPLVGPPLVAANPVAARRHHHAVWRSVRVGCTPEDGAGGGRASDGDGAAAWLNSAVGEKVDELLRREENRSLLEGVEAAERRVERARAALADIERQEAAARLAREEVRRLEKRRDEVCNHYSPRRAGRLQSVRCFACSANGAHVTISLAARWRGLGWRERQRRLRKNG
jgi:hypothetical protein